MKREEIIKAYGNTEIPEVNAQPLRIKNQGLNYFNRTEQTTREKLDQAIDNLNHQHIQVLNEALEDKDKEIRELKQKLEDLKKQNSDLDFLLNDKKNKPKQLTKIQGLLTSNLRSRASSNTPYMAFFRASDDCKRIYRHSLAECEAQKCKHCEIPIIFRHGYSKAFFKTFTESSKNLANPKPNLKKGDSVILEGEFSESKGSDRPSFTCYSYRVLKDHEQ